MDHQSENPHPGHFWDRGQTSHGSHGQSFRNGGWISSIGKQIVSFLLGALIAAFVFGGKTQQFNDLLVWKGQVDTTIATMNHEGTWGSQNALRADAKELGRTDERLKKVEESVGKVDTMLIKIEDLKASVTELKTQQKR